MDQKMVERLFTEYTTVTLVKDYGPRKALVHMTKWTGMRTHNLSCASCGARRVEPEWSHLNNGLLFLNGKCIDGCSYNIVSTSICEVSISKTGNFRFRWI